MDEIIAALAEHPIRVPPYNWISFSRHDSGKPLYRIAKKEAGGALKAMRAAHAIQGSSCFYCGKPMLADAAGLVTIDHIQPVSIGGTDDLHNLVFCCQPCNAKKGNKPIAKHHPERAADYVNALEQHHQRALKVMTGRSQPPKAAEPPATTQPAAANDLSASAAAQIAQP